MKPIFNKNKITPTLLLKAIKQSIDSYEGKYGSYDTLKDFKKINIKNIAFYYKVDFEKEKITLVIRGSDDSKDWKKNFDYKKKETFYGKVHKGFYEMAYEIAKFISFKSTKYRRSLYTVDIIGHSMGGAVGKLLSIILEPCYKAITLITLGEPRNTNLSAAQYFNSLNTIKHIRIINGDDFVTHLPPCFFNYKHTGKKVFLGLKGFIGSLIATLIKNIIAHYPNIYLKNFKLLKNKINYNKLNN